jgi:hypothetical protein
VHAPDCRVIQATTGRVRRPAAQRRFATRPRRWTPAGPACWCRRRPGGEWAWAAKLQLEDATGRLDALLLGRHAQALLGQAPCDLGASPAALGRVRQALGAMGRMDPRGVDRDGEGCAWLEVALTSVYGAAAAAAARAAAAHAELGAQLAGGGLDEAEAAALADPAGCVYVIHDTLPDGGG